MWLASLGGSALALLTQVALARTLAPAGYGAFAAALATVTLLVPLAGFGVPDLWLKAFGAEGSSAVRWLPASFRFAALSTTGVFLVLVAWAAWGSHEAATRQLLYWLSPVCAGQLLIGLVGAKLQLEERYGAFAVWHLLPNLARLLLVLLLVAMAGQTTPSDVAAAYALVAVGIVASGVILLRAMSQGRFIIKGHSRATPADEERRAAAPHIRLWDVVREASPFGLGTVFHLIYFQSAVVMLQYLQGDAAAGIYNVAFTVMVAVYLFPGAVFQKFLLPKVHRWANHDRARFLQVYRFGNGLMLLLGGAAAAAVLVLGSWLVPLLFGTAYREASNLLKLLAFCVPFRFLASSVGATLMTQDNMRRKNRYMAVVAVINVFLNLSLIPTLAATGAAIATLLSEIILLALYLIAVRRHVFGPEAWRGWTLRYRSGRV
jgi:O-antigen/teichoic acid export membrane protein